MDKFYSIVDPKIEGSIIRLCAKPYPNHPHGCPNLHKKANCPPKAKFIGDIIDLSEPIFVIWNKFDIGEHTKKMWEKHPEWTERQAHNCLYWQPKARKQLKEKIQEFLREKSGFIIVDNPEACGINITETMHRVGIDLEWPPRKWAYQVVLAGKAR